MSSGGSREVLEQKVAIVCPFIDVKNIFSSTCIDLRRAYIVSVRASGLRAVRAKHLKHNAPERHPTGE